MSKDKSKRTKKFRRRFNARLVKHNLSYSTREIADLFHTALNTVNNWYKLGLETIDDKKPSLVFGENLIKFLNNKNNKRKQKCALNEIYCCKCQSPHKTWEGLADIEYIDSKRILIMGPCETCNSKIYKLAAAKSIGEIKKTFHIQVIQNEQL